MTAPEPREDVAVAEVLAAHYATGVELTTPRQYTARGGWNVTCTCGDVIGETDDDDIEGRHNAHVAEALAPLIAERERAAAVEALREAADVSLLDHATHYCGWRTLDHDGPEVRGYCGSSSAEALRDWLNARADRRAER